MDGLRRALFRALVDTGLTAWKQRSMSPSSGRYYERFADHAVAIAQSVIYIETGTKPEDGAPHVG